MSDISGNECEIDHSFGRATANSSTLRRNIWMLLFASEFQRNWKSYSQQQHTPTRHLDAAASSGALEKWNELQQATARSDGTPGCYFSPQNFRGIERVTASSSTLRRDIWMLLLAAEALVRDVRRVTEQTTARSDETSGCYCSPQNFRGIERVTASSSTLRRDLWMLLLVRGLRKPRTSFLYQPCSYKWLSPRLTLMPAALKSDVISLCVSLREF